MPTFSCSSKMLFLLPLVRCIRTCKIPQMAASPVGRIRERPRAASVYLLGLCGLAGVCWGSPGGRPQAGRPV